MRAVSVTGSQGRQWTVRVVWQPRWRALARRIGGWRRKRREREESKRGGGGDGWAFDLPVPDDLFAAILIIVGLILFGLLFWFLLLPLALLLVDLIVVVLLMLLAIPARVLLGRPWTVEAVSPNADEQTEDWFATHIVGWRKALAARDDIADKLASGHPAPIVGTLATRDR